MDLASKIKISSEKIVSIAESADQALFFKKPSVDEWSIAEVIDHLHLVNTGLLERFNAALKEEAKAVPLPKRLVPFDVLLGIRLKRVNAPEHVKPVKANGMTKSQLLANFKSTRSELLKFFEKNGDVLPKITPKHPFFGYLTGTVMQKVIIGHDKRHTKQMQEILKRISGPNKSGR